jgi:hypothetical protein
MIVEPRFNQWDDQKKRLVISQEGIFDESVSQVVAGHTSTKPKAIFN